MLKYCALGSVLFFIELRRIGQGLGDKLHAQAEAAAEEQRGLVVPIHIQKPASAEQVG